MIEFLADDEGALEEAAGSRFGPGDAIMRILVAELSGIVKHGMEGRSCLFKGWSHCSGLER